MIPMDKSRGLQIVPATGGYGSRRVRQHALSYVEHVPNPSSQAAAERYRSALAIIGTEGSDRA